MKKNSGWGQGFEPRQAESESAVLPLDDPPALWNEAHKIEKSANYVKSKKGLQIGQRQKVKG